MEKISALRARRAELLAQLERLDAAIGKYEEWEREVSNMLTDEDVPTHTRHEDPQMDKSPTPMAEFEDAAMSVLNNINRPLMRMPFLEALKQYGVVIGGSDERNTLSARLSRMDGIVNLKGHGYWLADRDYPPAQYAAKLDERTGKSNLTRLAEDLSESEHSEN